MFVTEADALSRKDVMNPEMAEVNDGQIEHLICSILVTLSEPQPKPQVQVAIVFWEIVQSRKREMDRKKVTGFMYLTSSKSTRAYLPQNIQTWVHHQNKVHQIKCKVGFESKGQNPSVIMYRLALMAYYGSALPIKIDFKTRLFATHTQTFTVPVQSCRLKTAAIKLLHFLTNQNGEDELRQVTRMGHTLLHFNRAAVLSH